MRVGIVGLGIAGMRAAMLLEQAGVEVELFEARDRLGGRMQTCDQGGGAVYEAGGEWIDSDHERCLSLAHELGIPMTSAGSEPRHFLFAGERCTEDNLWPDALQDEFQMEAAARDAARNLSVPAWLSPDAVVLDNMTLAEFIRAHSTSDRGRWLLTARSLSDEGDDPERIGLLGWLAGYLNYLQRMGGEMSAFQFEGGAARLFGQMQARVSAQPRFGKVLERVEQGPESVTLAFSDESSETFDHVLLTLPPRALERVVFTPALSPDKRCAIEACRMSRVIKICFEFSTRWWSEAGWSGSMQCDLPLQQTWDGSRSSAPILTAYICGKAAHAWIHHPDPVALGVEQLAELYPAARDTFVRGWIHDWISDPLSGGGFSHTAPGYVVEHMPHIAGPEGCVHFAGEHTSPWVGFIEGALESAERASEEIRRS